MIFVDISQCTTNLDFKPLKAWPEALPAMAWHRALIAGFEHSGSAVALDGSFDKVIKSCYEDLSFLELARLIKCIQNTPEPIALEPVVQSYGYRFSDDLMQTVEMVTRLPLTVQNIFARKGFGPKELSIVRIMTHDYSDFWAYLAGDDVAKRFSRNQLSRALELVIELTEGGHALNSILPKSSPQSETSESWLRALEALRYPATTLRDRERSTRVREIMWPRETESRWQRTGDSASLELKLCFRSQDEFISKVEKLKQLGADLEDLWKFH